MKIETFYTGGGIWISQHDAGDGHYAVVDSEHPEYFSIYRKTEDEDDLFLPENMVSSKAYNELGSTQKEMYKLLIEELKQKGAI